MTEARCRYVFKYGKLKGKRCPNSPVLADGYCHLHSCENEEWRKTKSLRRLLEKYVQRGLSLEGAHLPGVDLRFIQLAGAGLEEAVLEGCNFYRARMPRAQLIKAKIVGAEFSGANLRQASLESAHGDRANFCDANLTGANLTKASLVKARFENAIATGAKFVDCLMLFADFLNASLEATDFQSANLTHANFESAHLLRVNFAGANLDSVRYDALTVVNQAKMLERSQNPPHSWAIHFQQASGPRGPAQLTPKPRPKPISTGASAASRPPSHLLPGDSFGDAGRYKIIKKLGQGGMAWVYLVKDRKAQSKDETYKALKILNPNNNKDEMTVKRFRREGQLIQELTHPRIIRIFDIGHSGDYDAYYLIMDYINGTDLEGLLERLRGRGRTMLNAFGAHLALQLCEGLAFTHGRDIIHRDLKPANILVRKDRNVVITDFGLSKFSGSIEDTLHLSTLPGTILGTFDYMAPEQLMGETITPATDIYSFGVMLYEMYTGERPYSSTTVTGWIKTITRTVPEVPSKVNTQVPRWLDGIIMRCLAKDPSARFDTVRNLKLALLNKS